jgi:hypothetical protein
MNVARLSFWKLGHAGSIVLIVLSNAALRAQSISDPIKPGLRETQVTTSIEMTLPPDLEAKIAAMPAAQQAQMRSMMGGPAAKPTSSTNKSCVAQTTSVNDLLNQAQQKAGMKCTFSNRQQTANAVSFDMSCTTAQGTATGHMQFTMADSDHGTGTTHMTVAVNSKGQTMSMTMDGSSSYTYLGADCGDVKPATTVTQTQ